jgi:hypothetical protein
MDSLKKQNNCIFKGRFNNSMRAVYEDKKIYAKNICFTLVSPLPKKKSSQFPGSLVFVTVVPPPPSFHYGRAGWASRLRRDKLIAQGRKRQNLSLR